KKSNIVFSGNHQTNYCEHLIRFSLGPVVSKLDFGLLNDIQDQSKAEITNSIVIPTENLIDVIPLIVAQLENPSVKKGLLKKLDDIKNSLKDFKYESIIEKLHEE
ncbi:TPA: hypothetical protein JIN62_003825, partial [Acinetobacter baumannii]|nr:hypothetical protein [Acinetobacter baumannii]